MHDSKQVALLEDAGYVGVEKRRVDRKTRTWLSLTEAGVVAYTRHLTALQAIAGLSPGCNRPAAENLSPLRVATWPCHITPGWRRTPLPWRPLLGRRSPVIRR